MINTFDCLYTVNILAEKQEILKNVEPKIKKTISSIPHMYQDDVEQEC